MRRALIIGGTGLIGRAVASRLIAAGWQVDLTGRNAARMPASLMAAGARFVTVDRSDDAALLAAAGDGADLIVDCLCYTAADAARLAPLARAANSAVMISSNAVYVDAAGYHTNSETSPNFGRPVREDQPTMAPSASADHQSRDGYGACKVAAEQVLLDSGAPVTVLRPGKIHGPWAARPREWVFVKRVLDRRPAVFLARRGTGVAQTVAADNVAALIEAVAEKPGRRILNSADPDAPSALEIARTIAGLLGHSWDEVLLDDPAQEASLAKPTEPAGPAKPSGPANPSGSAKPSDPAKPSGPAGPAMSAREAKPADPALGRHPWQARFPIVLEMTAALELGYIPAGDYASTVAGEVEWLVSAAAGHAGEQALAWLSDGYFDSYLDYASEDRYLAEQAG
ncbi:MAG TPA: NAD-dependent epimerase/dehydratase family protein [Streptosporangiaceae bacterium]|nr:NAD-dependent epimerase/dehydratase family protein [Streptosporangiaceae bacterium]